MELKELETGEIVTQKYKCSFCPYSTTMANNYKRHLKVHHNEKPFKCPECPFRTKLKGNVKHHLKNIHLLRSPSATRPFPCPESGCNYAAKMKAHLTTHSKFHCDKEPEFSCSHSNCNYSSNWKANFIRHMQIHTETKPFVCQFESCSYATVEFGKLVTHSRIHTKERPFKCPEPNCEYATGHSSHLKRHQLTQHPKEGEQRPSFKCPLCEYSSRTKGDLTDHIQTHTLEKLFKCDEPNCNFEAKRKAHLKTHKVVHSDEKPFACSVESCEYRAKHKSSLSTHLKSHSDERIYKCELCPFRAKERGVVTNHLKNIHSDPKLRPFKRTEPKCDHTSKTKGNLKEHILIQRGDKKYSCSFADCDYHAVLKSMVKSHQAQIHGL